MHGVIIKIILKIKWNDTLGNAVSFCALNIVNIHGNKVSPF